MDEAKQKILMLAAQSGVHSSIIDQLRHCCDVVEVSSIDQAIERLRNDHISAVFSSSGDFLALDRALVLQQSNVILNTIGEGVCIVDGNGRCSWMNKKMEAWPARVREKVRDTCREAFELFFHQNNPPNNESPSFGRSKRYNLNIEEQQYMEMIASPVINPAGAVVQVVAVVWDATGNRRLQQTIDAIDKAGRELVRIESEAIIKMNVGQRLKFLEDKIINFSKELMHFDHFAIRVLDRKSNKLEIVISAGLPTDAVNIELYASAEGNGISGYVAATGRSYICPDIERDPRYVTGLDQAKSSLTVPLYLNDKVIGIFNIESVQRGAFTENDRQFAEIFGRYVAIALNILDLMVVERVKISHEITDVVCSEVAGPLNDIIADTNTLLEDYIDQDDLRNKLQLVLDNATLIRKSLRQAAEGQNTKVLGMGDVKIEADPIIANARILVADDEPNLRTTISDILRKYHAKVTMTSSGLQAIEFLNTHNFDLVISDIKMPDKSGYEVFAEARKRSKTIPVILMTGFGYDPNHSIVRASQEGLQAVLFKPFRVEQLLGEVRKALQLQPTARA